MSSELTTEKPAIITLVTPLTQRLKRRVMQCRYQNRRKSQELVRFDVRLTRRSIKVIKRIAETEKVSAASIIREFIDEFACGCIKKSLLEHPDDAQALQEFIR